MYVQTQRTDTAHMDTMNITTDIWNAYLLGTRIYTATPLITGSFTKCGTCEMRP